MGVALERRLKQRPIKDPVVEGVLNLLVTGAFLNDQFGDLFGRFGLTTSAYNVLRILRGAPDGHPRGEIAQRMVNRAPDITRLIDRLQRRGLVRRARSRSDRRLSVTRITPKGLELLERVEPAQAEYLVGTGSKLPPAVWRRLSEACERLYSEEE